MTVACVDIIKTLGGGAIAFLDLGFGRGFGFGIGRGLWSALEKRAKDVGKGIVLRGGLPRFGFGFGLGFGLGFVFFYQTVKTVDLEFRGVGLPFAVLIDGVPLGNRTVIADILKVGAVGENI